MKLVVLKESLSVCKLNAASPMPVADFTFVGKTDEELSLVCPTEAVPNNTLEREDGWRAFRIAGVLDFSLIGILAKISRILADNGIGLFTISTFNTDYILIKEENFETGLRKLAEAGYDIDQSRVVK